MLFISVPLIMALLNGRKKNGLVQTQQEEIDGVHMNVFESDMKDNDMYERNGMKHIFYDAPGHEIERIGVDDSPTLFFRTDTLNTLTSFFDVLLLSMVSVLVMSTNGIRSIMDCDFKHFVSKPLPTHIINIMFLLVVIVYTSGQENTSPWEAALLTGVLYLWFLMITKLSGRYVFLLIVILVITFFVTHNKKYISYMHELDLKDMHTEEEKELINQKLNTHKNFHNTVVIVLILALVLLSFIGFYNHLRTKTNFGRSGTTLGSNMKAVFSSLFLFEKCT